MSQLAWKRAARYFGWAVMAVSLYFVLMRLQSEWQDLRHWRPDRRALAIILLAGVGYGVACLFLTNAWYLLLKGLDNGHQKWTIICGIYAKSQIAKYLPGNVFHVLGRQLLGHHHGLRHSVLAASTLYEFFGLVAASASMAMPAALTFDLIRLGTISSRTLFLMAVFGCAMLFFGHRLTRQRWPHLITIKVLKNWLFAYLNYLLFFLLAGLLLVALVGIFSHRAYEPSVASFLVASFALSWLAGFLTPGAPSGLGVRESIIVLILQPLLPEAPAAMIAILLRAVTVSGDLLFFLSAGSLVPAAKKQLQ